MTRMNGWELISYLFRCTRSCFQCPICTAPLSISSTESPPEGLGAEYVAQSGPYVLNCAYCLWSSKEIGIQLEKPNSIYAQLAKIKNGGEPYISPKERRRIREERKGDGEENQGSEMTLDPNEKLDAESQFANLKAFYQEQLAESSPASALGFTGDYGYGSPGALSRIMGLYTGSSFGDKKSKSRSSIMREAQSALEGLQISSPSASEESIARLRASGWEGTCSTAQRLAQAHNPRFVSDLRPIAHLLRTKRSKRCKTCRHILSKPESKVQNTRFRIRLVAPNYVPRIAIRPLQPGPAAPQALLLTPLRPTQFVLTFSNPLFDDVRVSIATPAKTPGRFGSRVTILCPQFEVGANTDVWDEALREGGAGAGKGGEREKRRTKAEASEGQQQAEAGKVWERGRNWVSVVVEVVPAVLKVGDEKDEKEEEEEQEEEEGGGGSRYAGPLREDEDILEIPVFVRVEWEADVAQDEGAGLAAANNKDTKEEKEKRELAYWCVLGVGRIARD